MAGWLRFFGRRFWLVPVLLLVAISLFSLVPWRSEEDSLTSNVLLFSVININVIGLLVLIVLVSRNLIKLFFERRRGILGSKLRARLMGAFVLISIIPIALSFLVASGLINQAVQSWFNMRVESIVSSSLTMARDSISAMKMAVMKSSDGVSSEIAKIEGVLDDTALEALRKRYELYSITICESSGRVLNQATHPTSNVESFAEPPVDSLAISKVSFGGRIVRIEERGASQFIRVYTKVPLGILVVSYRVDPELVHAQAVITEAVADYKESKELKDPIKTNFFLVLALFNLITLFGAIWVSFFISKQITGPIQLLIQGAHRVAQGNYDFTVEAVRDDEIGYLVNSFNHMIEQLKLSKKQLEQRRLLLDTIVSNLGVGVISLNQDFEATTINKAACTILDIRHADGASVKVPLSELLTGDQYAQLHGILRIFQQSPSERTSGTTAEEIRFRAAGREAIVLCTAGSITAADGEVLGYVLLLDDITELSRSQHLAAWRDVARRIAHEIKNPLTPLQLSAQRLEKLAVKHGFSQSLLESTKSIVEHVEIIKRLANEFSEYGRMPVATFAPTRIDILLDNIVRQAQTDYPNISFSLDVHGRIPEMLLDPNQVRGVFMNLLTNAVASIDELESGLPREIRIILSFDTGVSRAVIEVVDSGVGIAAEDKGRIFEPYFTRKKGGTGLGLAIVSSIVSDHGGDIRVFDNEPRGVRFVLTLPQHPQAGLSRRI